MPKNLLLFAETAANIGAGAHVVDALSELHKKTGTLPPAASEILEQARFNAVSFNKTHARRELLRVLNSF